MNRRKKLMIPKRIRPPKTAPIGISLSLGCSTSTKASIGFRKKIFKEIVLHKAI